MNLLKDLKINISLNISFFMIYIIQEMLVLLKNHQNYLKDNILECFFKEYNRLLFFDKIIYTIITCNNGKSKAWRRKHN